MTLNARILRLVNSNLDEAVISGDFEEGGYLHGFENAPDLIAIEMVAFAEEIIAEGLTTDQLIPYIEDWMGRRPQ